MVLRGLPGHRRDLAQEGLARVIHSQRKDRKVFNKSVPGVGEGGRAVDEFGRLERVLSVSNVYG